MKYMSNDTGNSIVLVAKYSNNNIYQDNNAGYVFIRNITRHASGMETMSGRIGKFEDVEGATRYLQKLHNKFSFKPNAVPESVKRILDGDSEPAELAGLNAA